MVKKGNDIRCGWCGEDEHYIRYHDEEWGVPIRAPEQLFELLCLEGMQAGLSWLTVLKKRDRMRHVFNGFDPKTVSRFGENKIQQLLTDAGIIRHRGKISAVISNARCYLELASEQKVDDFFWSFTGRQTKQNCWESLSQVPAQTEQSRAMSAELKTRGFKFVGPTICYAFMQSAGMVNDHLTSCFRYQACKAMSDKQGTGK